MFFRIAHALIFFKGADSMRSVDNLGIPHMPSGRTPQLTASHRDMLIEHLDTNVPVQRHFDPYRNQIRRKLVDDGLLKLDRPSFPNYTSLTDLGRDHLCKMLADYADTLARVELRRTAKAELIYNCDPSRPSPRQT